MKTPMTKLMLAAFAALSICFGARAGSKDWMVVDLKTGAVSYYGYDFDTATNTFNTAEYKLSKMAFRRIEAGNSYYVQNGAYTAQMERPYYVGIFPVTVAQYETMGNPNLAYTESQTEKLKAQGYLSRNVVRGTNTIPSTYGSGMTSSSTLAKFNTFVQEAMQNANLVFDLPTRAMWEVAARAIPSGDTTHMTWDWFFGETAHNVAFYGFVKGDSSADDYGFTSETRVPGSRLPNAWGLYDIFGNVREVVLENNGSKAQGQWTQTNFSGGYYNLTLGSAFNDDPYSVGEGVYHDGGAYDHCGMRLTMIDYTTWDGEGDGTEESPYIIESKERFEAALHIGGNLFLKLSEDLTLEGPIAVPTSIATLTIDLNGGSITGATGQAAIVLAGGTAFAATGTGTISADDGIEAVKRPGSVTAANGVTVTGIGGGAAVDAPSFSESGESAVTKFEGAGDTWTLTAFAEMEGDSVGTAVTDGQIKVYAADSVEGLEDAEPVSEGVTVTERKSAVKTTIEVVLPGTPEKQFFKVKFGE